jgi:hypothetical protein
VERKKKEKNDQVLIFKSTAIILNESDLLLFDIQGQKQNLRISKYLRYASIG